jgi:hypothetical protein
LDDIKKEETPNPLPQEAEVKYLSIKRGEHSRQAGLYFLLKESLNLDEDIIEDILSDMPNPLVVCVAIEQSQDVYNQAFGYGYGVEWVEMTSVYPVEFKTQEISGGGGTLYPELYTEDCENEVIEVDFELDINTHFDVVVCSVKEDLVDNNLTAYWQELNKTVKSSMVVFGSEARITGLDADKRIICGHGTSGNMEETYAMYEGLDLAIGSVLYDPEYLPGETDVNITLITERGVDYGSRNSKNDLVELIGKLERRFGWSFSVLCREKDSKEVASDLGIDTSNSMNFGYMSEAINFMAVGRKKRNKEIHEGNQKPFNYFK